MIIVDAADERCVFFVVAEHHLFCLVVILVGNEAPHRWHRCKGIDQYLVVNLFQSLVKHSVKPVQNEIEHAEVLQAGDRGVQKLEHVILAEHGTQEILQPAALVFKIDLFRKGFAHNGDALPRGAQVNGVAYVRGAVFIEVGRGHVVAFGMGEKRNPIMPGHGLYFLNVFGELVGNVHRT